MTGLPECDGQCHLGGYPPRSGLLRGGWEAVGSAVWSLYGVLTDYKFLINMDIFFVELPVLIADLGARTSALLRIFFVRIFLVLIPNGAARPESDARRAVLRMHGKTTQISSVRRWWQAGI